MSIGSEMLDEAMIEHMSQEEFEDTEHRRRLILAIKALTRRVTDPNANGALELMLQLITGEDT